jgi:hypothetical protein
VRPVEDDHSGLGKGPRDVRRAVRVPVVVSEDGDDRRRHLLARLRENARLVDLAELRQIAREQDEVGLLVDALEGCEDPHLVLRSRVQVAARGDADGSQSFAHDRSGYDLAVADDFQTLLEAMRRAARTLHDAGIPFALAGGVAVYAWGGPDSDHDVDFLVRPADADRALEALVGVGFRGEKPPEGWLYKAFDASGAMIDLIFEPANGPVTDALLERSTDVDVHAIHVPVAPPTDILASKLLALREHNLDYSSALEIARAVREQIDWPTLRRETEHSPYARAFFTLVDELGLAS